MSIARTKTSSRPVTLDYQAAAVLLLLMVLANMRQFAGVAVLSRHLRATELAELRLIESLRAEPGLALDVQGDTYLIFLMARVPPRDRPVRQTNPRVGLGDRGRRRCRRGRQAPSPARLTHTWVKTADEILAKAVRKPRATSESGN